MKSRLFPHLTAAVRSRHRDGVSFQEAFSSVNTHQVSVEVISTIKSRRTHAKASAIQRWSPASQSPLLSGRAVWVHLFNDGLLNSKDGCEMWQIPMYIYIYIEFIYLHVTDYSCHYLASYLNYYRYKVVQSTDNQTIKSQRMNNMWPHRTTPVSCVSAITVSWTIQQSIRGKTEPASVFQSFTWNCPSTCYPLLRLRHVFLQGSFPPTLTFFTGLDLDLNLGSTPVSLCEATTQGVNNPEDISAVIQPAAVWTCSAQGPDTQTTGLCQFVTQTQWVQLSVKG